MKKTSLMTLTLFMSLILTACGKTEEERLISAQADVACESKKIIEEMAADIKEAAKEGPEAVMNKINSMGNIDAILEEKLVTILKENGFESEEAADKAMENYNEAELEKKAQEKAKEQCDFSEEILETIMEDAMASINPEIMTAE